MDTNPLGASTMYHQPTDLPENLDPEAVRAVIAIYSRFLEHADRDQDR
jgi:hypothetical protein